MQPFDLSDLPGFEMSEPYPIDNNRESFGYIINKGIEFRTRLGLHHDLIAKSDFWQSPVIDKIKTLLFNHIKFEDKIYSTPEEIHDFVNSHYPRLNPNQKILSTLEYLYSLTKYDGEMINLDKNELQRKSIWRKLFFNNVEELEYYIDNLNGSYIKFEDASDTYIGLQLTVSGLLKVGEYLESKGSNICFVAMSFDKTLFSIYDDAIAPAITESGFKPLIIRKEHINSDVTINDAIIADIKKARFTIADFTLHKAGVYFEAGYALGRGQKVIYLCREDEIDKAHFDTRNYQHIVWKAADDLKEQLIAKIEAFIKD
jgi:hypothetical protein